MNTNLFFETLANIRLETFTLIIKGLWEKIQDESTLEGIENIVFFILFIRFVILTLKYNLKTAFYITCIGLFAGYLWYKHLVDTASGYVSLLVQLPFPFFQTLAFDVFSVPSGQNSSTDSLFVKDYTHWYTPGKILYSAFTKGIIHQDTETNIKYYIDPISMIISNLPESNKVNILPIYYTVYKSIIPKIFQICSQFWYQFSGIGSYVLITRLGKRYCPYLIRWHWTFIMMGSIIESIIFNFVNRVFYFKTHVLFSEDFKTDMFSSLIKKLGLLFNGNFKEDLKTQAESLQAESLNVVIIVIIFIQFSYLFFGLFHAIVGQYFYIPFFVENTELHIGSRPTNSIFSAGKTAWQDITEQEEILKGRRRLIPKLWYGWFGRGTKNQWNLGDKLKLFFDKIINLLSFLH